MRTLKTLLALTLAIAACGKKADETPPTKGSGTEGSGSATMAGSGSAMAGSGSAAMGSDQGSGSGAAMAGSGSGAGSGGGSGDAAAAAMAHHAGNCPSTVLNSTTTAAVKGKDVIVTISSKDKDSILAIQKRTDELLKERMDKKAPGDAHDQRGTHGGKMGLCPVHIPEGAKAKSKHDKGGVTVTITPKDKPDDLKKDIDERITKSADWVKANIKPADKGDMGGVGGGKGDHGSNHSGQGDSKGKDRKDGGSGKGTGGGSGGGGGKGTGGGDGGSGKKK